MEETNEDTFVYVHLDAKDESNNNKRRNWTQLGVLSDLETNEGVACGTINIYHNNHVEQEEKEIKSMVAIIIGTCDCNDRGAQ